MGADGPALRAPIPRRRRLAGAVLVAATLLAACGARDLRFDRIVLVTYDTTRADHLGAYGYPRATSPFFDSLGERGVLFERAISATPTTVPSHATMFTALYPLEHGLGHNGQRLPRGIPTLAELLSEAGFATAGFVSLGLLRHSGLERGFQRIEYRGPRRGGDTEAVERGGQATSRAAIEWLREQPRGGRFFLWVHYYDPHTPYLPPEETLATLHATSGPLDAHRELLFGQHGIRLEPYRGDVARMLDRVDRYDGELRAMDDALGALYRAAGELGHADGSIWIVAGDHGEGLGSHDWLEHGIKIYQEQMRVPLLVHDPGTAVVARRVGDVVELVDLLPTIADLAGIAAPAGVRGRSLVPYLSGEPPPAIDREAFVQRRTFKGIHRPPDDRPLTGRELWEDGERLGLVGRRWKYIHWTVGAPELYDLESDPTESRNLASERTELVEAMRERLLARARQMRSRGGVPEVVDDRTLEILRSLGYLQ